MSTVAILSAADVVQAQFDAYNAQDLDALCATLADEVIQADLNGAVILQGLDAYRARYAQMFATFPQNRASLVNRISLGATVIDHEQVSRAPGGEAFEAIVIYTVSRGRISRMDFVK